MIRLVDRRGTRERLRWTDQHPGSRFGLGVILRGHSGAVLDHEDFEHLVSEGTRIECGSDLERRRVAGALALTRIGHLADAIFLERGKSVTKDTDKIKHIVHQMWTRAAYVSDHALKQVEAGVSQRTALKEAHAQMQVLRLAADEVPVEHQAALEVRANAVGLASAALRGDVRAISTDPIKWLNDQVRKNLDNAIADLPLF